MKYQDISKADRIIMHYDDGGNTRKVLFEKTIQTDWCLYSVDVDWSEFFTRLTLQRITK